MTIDLTHRIKRYYWMLRSKSHRKSVRQKLKKRSRYVAAYFWRRLLVTTKFIVVSGSVGKTTTKEMLSAVLAQKYSTINTPGNWHGRFGGIEATILRTRPWHRYVVIESGIEKPGDMRTFAKLLKPDIALMLGVKRCHTNIFKTLEAIANEKSQLLHNVRRNGYAVINQDDSYVADMTYGLTCKIIRFGSGKDADFQLRSSDSRWPNRLTLEVERKGIVYAVNTRLVGTHWTPTVMATLATTNLCGISFEESTSAISSVEPFWARMQPITLVDSGATIIRDDWMGSIDMFDAAIRVMEDADASRKIIIFSDYSDSNKSQRTRANRLGKTAARFADVAIFVGDYADRSAKAAISEGLDPDCVHAFVAIPSVIDFLRNALRQGDLVLIKGKLSHHLTRIYLGLLGDVKCRLPTCSKQILCDRCPELGFGWRPDLKGYMAAPRSYA